MKEQLTVLVTGATGHQGGALTRALLARGHKVRAFTRHTDSPHALALSKLGAELWRGDFSDKDSLFRAAKECDAMFSMTTPYESGADDETYKGMREIDVARDAKVGHFVFTSVCNADKGTGIPFFDSKYRMEQYLQAQNIPYTIVAPAYFMENLFSPWSLPSLRDGVLLRPLPPTKRIKQIAVEDIGNFTAIVMEHPEKFLGKRIDLASDDVTGFDEAAILCHCLGRSVVPQGFSEEQLRQMGESFTKMSEYFTQHELTCDIASLQEEYPEVGWHSYEDWAKNQDWTRLRLR